MSHATTNTANVGAVATRSVAGTATIEPSVITERGPCRSSHRPTGTPTAAATSRLAENAAATALRDQPVSALIVSATTGNA